MCVTKVQSNGAEFADSTDKSALGRKTNALLLSFRGGRIKSRLRTFFKSCDVAGEKADV